MRIRRCPATVKPPRGTSQGACPRRRTHPRRKGRSGGTPAEPTSSARRGGFMHKKVLAALLGAAAVLALSPGLVAEAARRQESRSRSSSARRWASSRSGSSRGGSSRSRRPDGDAVRDRRGSPGRRGRRAVELSRPCAQDEALGLHAERRGDRELPPRPRDRARGRGADGVARQARHPSARPARGLEASAGLRAGHSARTCDRPPEGRGRDRPVDAHADLEGAEVRLAGAVRSRSTTS